MNTKRKAVTFLIATSLVLIMVVSGICENLERLHHRRIEVEFILDGKLGGVGSIEFYLPSSLFGPKNKQDGKVIYIYFIKFSGDQVAPMVHIMDLTTIKMVDKDTIVFSGQSDFGFPFSGNITGYGKIKNERFNLTISGNGVLEIKTLLSEEAKTFKAQYIDKVHLGF